MQQVDSNWKSILSGSHHFQTKVDISGVSYYGSTDIFSCTTSQNLFSGGSSIVGNCIAGKLNLTIRKPTSLPRMGKIELFCRACSEDLESSWLPQGVYFVDTRKKLTTVDIGFDVLEITAYDCIMKLEQPYITGIIQGWPKTNRAIAQDIAQKIGTSIDERTVVSDTYICQADPTLSMRQYMGYIAAAQAGNWVATADGKLRLVSVFDIPEETSYLTDELFQPLVFGSDRILV